MNNTMELVEMGHISSKIDEHRFNVIFANKSIKAQKNWFSSLKKRYQKIQDTSCMISSANKQLQSEITREELKIESLRAIQNTLGIANVEIKTEWLIIKEKKENDKDLILSKIKKYENHWLECKTRYESLPFVQKLLKAQEAAKSVTEKNNELDIECRRLRNEIAAKRRSCSEFDKNKVLELAEFIILEIPKKIIIIQERSAALLRLKNSDPRENISVQQYKLQAESTLPTIEKVIAEKDTPDRALQPKTELASMDLDVFSAKLDRIKMKRGSPSDKHLGNWETHIIDIDAPKLNKDNYKKTDDDFMTLFLGKRKIENEKKDYSKRRLINILDDIKLDPNTAFKLVAAVDLKGLKSVEEIVPGTNSKLIEVGANDEVQSQAIGITEEMKVVITNQDNFLVPPTQFQDEELQEDIINTLETSEEKKFKSTQIKNSKFSSEDNIIKKVSFDLPSTSDTNPNIDVHNGEHNESYNSQLNASVVSDEGFEKIKFNIMKKHNIDLSPQFVYTKNMMTPRQKHDVITSKFFQENPDANIKENCLNAPNLNTTNEERTNTAITRSGDDIISSSQQNEVSTTSIEAIETNKELVNNDSVLLLLQQETQDVADSLNATSTTLGDGEADFSHYLDNSILLSPKSFLPVENNPTDSTQEVPSFMSGLRKNTLSLFGKSEPTSDTGDPGQESGQKFSFNFGGDQKKRGGGFFNMFQ